MIDCQEHVLTFVRFYISYNLVMIKMVNITKIKELCRTRGIKQSYICTQLGLARNYLSDVQYGKSLMTDDRLETIASILHTTPAYLKDETDNPDIPDEQSKETKDSIFAGLTDLEKQLLEEVMKMNEKDQMLALDLVKRFAESNSGTSSVK